MKHLLVLLTAAFLNPHAYSRPNESKSMEADLHKLTVIEDHRDGSHPFLLEALHSQHTALVKKSLVAFGRIGDPAAMTLISSKLKDPQPDIRLNAAFALGLMKNAQSLPLLQEAALREEKPEVRDQIYQALGRLQEPETLGFFKAALEREKDPVAQSGLGMGLCFLFLSANAPGWDVPTEIFDRLYGLLNGEGPAPVSAAWGLARYKGDVKSIKETELNAAIAKMKDYPAKAIAIKALSRFKTDSTRQALVQLLKTGESSNVKIEAANGLIGQTESEESIKALLMVLQKDSAMIQVAALSTLASYKTLDLAFRGELNNFYQKSSTPWVKGKALTALAAQLQGDELKALLLEALKEKNPYFKRELMTQLPKLGDEGLKWLQGLLDDPSLLIAGGALGVLHDLEKERIHDGLKASILKQLQRHDPVMTSTIIDAAGKFGWNDTIPLLMKIGEEKWPLAEFPVQEMLMSSFSIFADPTTLPLVEKNLQHPVVNVVVKAVEAYTKITGKAPDRPLPLNNKVEETTPSAQEIAAALKSQVILETSKGRIRLEMIADAPLTATKFVAWSKRAFYDGLAFHRVVPHWVVQGGDPRGDGEGGSGLIRDEVSMIRHDPYTLGIATSGKDTGSTQMFFNLGANTRLDGAYTVFARVIEGFIVVDSLEIGDKILKATVTQTHRKTKEKALPKKSLSGK